MKKLLFLIICISMLSLCAFGQEVVDTDTIKVNSTEAKKEEKSSIFINGSSYGFIFQWDKKSNRSYPTSTYWTGLGISFSYLSGLDGVDLGNAYSVFLNVGDFVLPINHHFLFATGFGFDWQHYSFNGNVSLRNDNDGVTRFIYDNTQDYKSSKLRLYHITVPFIIEYQTKIRGRHMFFVHGGIEALIKTYSLSRAEIRRPNGVEIEKYKRLNISPLNVRLILRAGFSNFSFLGYYQPFSIFKKDKGPDINPYGIGVIFDL